MAHLIDNVRYMAGKTVESIIQKVDGHEECKKSKKFKAQNLNIN